MLAILLVCACETASGDVVWIPSDTDDRCNVVAVGDKVALFWSDDAQGRSELVDPEGVVVAREDGRIGVQVRGTLPPGTRPVPSYILTRQRPPDCRRGRRHVLEPRRSP